MKITNEYKKKVLDELNEVRKHYTGSDYAFATKWGIKSNIYTLIKDGADIAFRPDCVSDVEWVRLGRQLNISLNKRKWNIVRTEVFKLIEEEILFCKANSKAMMFVDDCEIGKTVTGKYLSQTLENCFYIDCSQTPTKMAFIKAFAQAIGVEAVGSYAKIKENIKYCLCDVLVKPVVILDEAGDINQETWLELKAFWNATDGCCGWYMLGADGLKARVKRGIAHETVGYSEIFSRYGRKYRRATPIDKTAKAAFYRELITAVLSANCTEKALVPELVKKCLATDTEGATGGLRRAESLLILTETKSE